MVRSLTGIPSPQGNAVTGETADAMDGSGLEGFGQPRRRQDEGEPPRQPRDPPLGGPGEGRSERRACWPHG
jgi:hypothetical protein